MSVVSLCVFKGVRSAVAVTGAADVSHGGVREVKFLAQNGEPVSPGHSHHLTGWRKWLDFAVPNGLASAGGTPHRRCGAGRRPCFPLCVVYLQLFQRARRL